MMRQVMMCIEDLPPTDRTYPGYTAGADVTVVQRAPAASSDTHSTPGQLPFVVYCPLLYLVTVALLFCERFFYVHSR